MGSGYGGQHPWPLRVQGAEANGSLEVLDGQGQLTNEAFEQLDIKPTTLESRKKKLGITQAF